MAGPNAQPDPSNREEYEGFSTIHQRALGGASLMLVTTGERPAAQASHYSDQAAGKDQIPLTD